MAVVTLRLEMPLGAAELIAYCKERMAAYKYPRVIEFRDELPKNALGKILKARLIPADGDPRSPQRQSLSQQAPRAADARSGVTAAAG
jgi:acyl-coenzyme A synthetase/AMP-(fatty) acid ligase